MIFVIWYKYFRTQLRTIWFEIIANIKFLKKKTLWRISQNILYYRLNLSKRIQLRWFKSLNLGISNLIIRLALDNTKIFFRSSIFLSNFKI